MVWFSFTAYMIESMFIGETICISSLALLWGGGWWLAGQTMVGDDISQWRPAYLRLTWYQSLLPPPSSQHIVCVRVTLSACLTLGLINVDLISTESIFSIGDEEFPIYFELFLLTLCLYFVLGGNKNVWPKSGVFYQTIFLCFHLMFSY